MDEDDDEAIMAPTASGWRASNIIAWSNGRARSGAPPVRPEFSAMRPDFRLSIGAGEGIRTLDPNLGKVVHVHAESPCFRKEMTSPNSIAPGFPPSRMTPGARLLAFTWE